MRHVAGTRDWSHVSVSRSADISLIDAEVLVTQLCRLGLIDEASVAESPGKPAEAVDEIRDSIQQMRNHLELQTATFRRAHQRASEISELLALADQRPGSVPMKTVRGADVAPELEALYERATGRIDRIVPATSDEIQLMLGRKRDASALRRGIQLRTVALRHIEDESSASDHYWDWLENEGAPLRVSVLPEPSVALFDSDGVVILDSDESGPRAVVVTCPLVIEVVASMFGGVWANAFPRTSSFPHRDEFAAGVDQTGRTVLRLLSEGHKDEAVSRRMGISVRTVRRVVTRISDQLGARSRFELAWRLRDVWPAPPTAQGAGLDGRSGHGSSSHSIAVVPEHQ